jgi:predicted Fe-Mo cluster-binding NifX family protein
MKTTILFVFAALALLAGAAGAADKGMIVVAAEGQTAEVSVSDLVARAPFFLFFDGTGKLLETVANPYRQGGGSGITVADFLARRGAGVIVAGGFGPKIADEIRGKGIATVSFKGSARDAVRSVLQVKNKDKQ